MELFQKLFSLSGDDFKPGNSEQLPGLRSRFPLEENYKKVRDSEVGLGTFSDVSVWVKKEHVPGSNWPKKIAVKELRFPRAAESSKYVDRALTTVEAFKDEPCSVNLVQLYGCGSTGRGPFQGLVMELCHGSLRDLAASGRKLDTRECSYIMSKVCSAVDFLHKKNYLHRDIRPGNILVNIGGDNSTFEKLRSKDSRWQTADVAEMDVKLSDFGLSRTLARNVATMTGKVGSKNYMAPELKSGSRAAYDHRVDIFSIGIVYMELLQGSRVVVTRKHEDLINSVHQNLSPAPAARNLILLALKLHPEERPSMEHIRKELGFMAKERGKLGCLKEEEEFCKEEEKAEQLDSGISLSFPEQS